MASRFNASSASGRAPGWRTLSIGLVSFMLLGCDRGKPSAQSPSRPSSRAGSRSARTVDGAKPPQTQHSDAGAAAASNKALDDGAIPFEYPVTAIAAAAGSYVLAPPREWIEQAFERGTESQTFVYYGAWLRETGARASHIEYLTGHKAVLPNSMIIAIRRGASAKPGDIVLTSWAAGAALQRAIVIEGGTPSRPRVRYLDLELDSPSGSGDKPDTLRENTFHPLNTPGEVGTSVACSDGSRRTHWIITHRTEQKMLVLGFAGKLRVFDERACRPLPLVPKLGVGDEAMVPVLGSFVAAKVERVEPQIGRVFVRVRSGVKEQQRAPSFANLTPPFEGW